MFARNCSNFLSPKTFLPSLLCICPMMTAKSRSTAVERYHGMTAACSIHNVLAGTHNILKV
eukprot:6718353-Pyramimonas_sp.AAC.1